MKLGILTGGGDVPGLNPCIKAVVNRAVAQGHEIVGVRRGWGGLLYYNRDDPEGFEKNFIQLDNQVVRKLTGLVAHFCILAVPILVKWDQAASPNS